MLCATISSSIHTLEILLVDKKVNYILEIASSSIALSSP